MRRSTAVLVFVGAWAVLAHAAEQSSGPFDSLIKNPPFGQTAGSGMKPGNETASLEFRGVFLDKGEYFFSLHDTATRVGQWVGLKESGHPYFVEDYDQAKGSIQVKYRNQVMTLTLKLAQVLVQAVPSPTGVPGPGGVAQGSVMPNAPDEARRLAQVADEIRRRRALRAGGPIPQPNAVGAPSRPGPMPQNPSSNPQSAGPMPRPNSPGNPSRSGPVPQPNPTGNPPPPGPLPTNP